MPFTVESHQSPEVGRIIDQPSQFNLPVKSLLVMTQKEPHLLQDPL